MDSHNQSEIQKLILNHFLWSRQVLLDKYPWDGVLFKQPDTKETWTTQYLIGAVYHNILHCFGTPDPVAMILVRRVDSSKAAYYRKNYLQTILETDPDGDCAYVDFCYAPGNYPFIIKFLRRLGTDYVIWTRDKTSKFHCVKANDLPLYGSSTLADELVCWTLPVEHQER